MTQQQAKRFEKHLRSPGDAVELKEPDGDSPRIRIPVSSTAEDRDGDQFSREGLENMREQLASGTVPMMLDHGRGSDGGWYGTLGMIGRWDGGEIESRDGETVLMGEGALNMANPDAERLRDYLDNDMPVGASVGFRVLEYERDRESDSYTFDAVDLLETSLVGIPSNPMTVNDGTAMEALAKAYSQGDVDDDVFANAFAALSDGETAPDELLDALSDTNSAPDAPGDTMTDSTDKDNADDSTDDDLLERLVSLQERMIEDVDETTKRLDDLEARLEKADDGDDDEDDDEDEEDDDKDADPDAGDDEKSVTISVSDDVDDDTVETIRSMVNAVEDGDLDLDESKTTLYGEDGDNEQADKQTDDTTDNGGWLQ